MDRKSVGIVKTEKLELSLPSEGFVLDKGGVLPKVEVAFERYGELAPDKDNVILICHALSGDAHAAGFHSEADKNPGWWDIMIGPGKGIDTNTFHVISSNFLGGCQGTTGPSSINPETGKPYGADFPEMTIGDMVKVQKMLLDELEIPKLHGVIGGSVGGLQVLEWCVRFPDSVTKAVCIAAAESLSAQALSFDIVGRNIIMADPYWNKGSYYGKGIPEKGLALARMVGHITYLSKESMAKKFGRERRQGMEKNIFTTDFEVESYLNYQGQSFVERFDANSYLYITAAMNSFSITEGKGSLGDVFRETQSQFLILSASSDWLYPPEQSKELAEHLLGTGKKVTYCNLTSPYGHDSFLIENRDLSNMISSFFSEEEESAQKSADISDNSVKRDFEIIGDMVEPGSNLLDLGCGDGSFLKEMFRTKGASGHGIDIDFENIIECNKKGVPAFQADLDEGLGMIPDNRYDYAILSRTLLEVHKPSLVLNEMLRVAREGIVSFPNFVNWKNRFRLGFKGKLPRSKGRGLHWYDTPNIHFLSLKDFYEFCREYDINILERCCIPDGIISSIFSFLGLCNLGAERVIMRISKSKDKKGCVCRSC